MLANQYQFLTKWHVQAPCELLYEILKEGKNYPRWWPEVYLGAEFEPSGRAFKLTLRSTILALSVAFKPHSFTC